MGRYPRLLIQDLRKLGRQFGDCLYSVIFEIRGNTEGGFHHLVTLWKATPTGRKLFEENALQKKANFRGHHLPLRRQRQRRLSLFHQLRQNNEPIQRVNVDFTAAKELNINRQAVIKTMLRQALDQRQIARSSSRRQQRGAALPALLSS